MAAPKPRERLRVTPRSLVVAVALLGATVVALRVLASSERVVGWIVAAAVLAGLLDPYATLLSRKLPRGIAVLLVAVFVVGAGSTITYALVDGIVREYNEISVAAPAQARRLEERGRFHESLRQFELSTRVERLVKDAPLRLQGGTEADALRSAATRGVAFVATGILALFFMLHGRRMAASAAEQVHTPARRQRLERVAVAAFHRGFGYARGSMAMSMLAGLTAWGLGSWAHVPGPAPLALWVALWDVVPVIGAAIGAAPIVGLAAINSPHWGIALGVVFIAYQLAEWLVLQRWIDRRTVHVGPFLTVVAGFAGLELYGVGGALVALLAVALAIAALDELAPPEDDRAAFAEAAEGADPADSAPVADGGQVGPVGVVEVDGERPVDDLAHDV
jgi:predicted PurR-regulated permease PerM